MRIIGIDPGTDRMGYSILDKGTELNLIDYGIINTPKNASLPERLHELANDFKSLVKEYKPTHLAIEKVFFSKNIKTATAISQVIGVISEAAYSNGLLIQEFSPSEVKSIVTGYGKSDKKNVEKMVQIIFNLETPPKPDDVVDAIAIAHCIDNLNG